MPEREIPSRSRVPTEVASVLREEGHGAIELREVLPPDATDTQVFGYAREHEMFLITCNRDDFLSLAADRANPGLIILIRRLAGSRERRQTSVSTQRR